MTTYATPPPESRFIPESPGTRYLVLYLDAGVARMASMSIQEVDEIEALTKTFGEMLLRNGVGTFSGEKGILVLDTRSPFLNW